jgi:hypothetical protein
MDYVVTRWRGMYVQVSNRAREIVLTSVFTTELRTIPIQESRTTVTIWDQTINAMCFLSIYYFSHVLTSQAAAPTRRQSASRQAGGLEGSTNALRLRPSGFLLQYDEASIYNARWGSRASYQVARLSFPRRLHWALVNFVVA